MPDQPHTLCRPEKARKPLTACFETAEVIVSAVLAIAILFSFVLRFAGVVGASMEPTLSNRDWLAITSYMHEPERGRIVIISPRTNQFSEPLVKRVIGLPGDEVDIRDGFVFINGHVITEPYLNRELRTERASEQLSTMIEYPLTVPPNMVFVLGDNRGGSKDSRHDAIGLVRIDDILGRVMFRLWPNPQANFTGR